MQAANKRHSTTNRNGANARYGIENPRRLNLTVVERGTYHKLRMSHVKASRAADTFIRYHAELRRGGGQRRGIPVRGQPRLPLDFEDDRGAGRVGAL